MEHVIMGTIVLMIALSLILMAIILSPKLTRLGIIHSARYSFAAMMILLGTYLGWISSVFYRNGFGPVNYTPELWMIRCVLLLVCLHFLWSAWRCDK